MRGCSELGGDDDEACFPRSLLNDNAQVDSDSSDDSESESFKKIQSVNVDHLISLAKRPSVRGSTSASANVSQVPTPPQEGTPTSSTPTVSVTATPPSVNRPLKTGDKQKNGKLGSRPQSRAGPSGVDKVSDSLALVPTSQNFDQRNVSRNFAADPQ